MEGVRVLRQVRGWPGGGSRMTSHLPFTTARSLRAAIIVAVPIALVVVAMLTRPSAAQPCNRTCSAAERDARGCCSASTPASKPKVEPPAERAGSSCPPRMARVVGANFSMPDLANAVSVSTFCLDLTEVTVDAYTACVGTTQCTTEHLGESSGNGATFTADGRCNYGVAGRGNHPMNCVDWGQSAIYCHAQGKRLPSEQEWEWAARGRVDARVYPWGNAAPDFQPCWSGISKRSGTCVVGTNPTSDAEGGFHDMAGNVSEWTFSNFDANSRVIRGGSWDTAAADSLRTAFRDSGVPSVRDSDLGFRCAR